MVGDSEYTGTHKVILPPDYMNSIEAVCDVHEEHISAVGTNLDIPGLQLTWSQRLVRLAFACLLIFLIPVIWQTARVFIP